jgi:hypothetical protein
MDRHLLLAVNSCLLLLLGLLLAPRPTAAQGSGPPSSITTGSPRDKALEDKFRSDEIERVKRATEQSAPRLAPEFPRIKEDFERIQIINNDVLQAPARGDAPDYAHISEAAGEIKKRAARLKANLFPAEKQSKEKGAEGPQDLQSLLAELDGAISGFVSNPMFQNLRVVDTQSAAKARRDLERVIKLSARVRQEADKKRKGGG